MINTFAVAPTRGTCRLIHSNKQICTRYVHSGPKTRIRGRLLNALKYVCVGVGGGFLSAVTFLAYKLGKLKLRGAEIIFSDRLLPGLPHVLYKDSSLDIAAAIRRDQYERFRVREDDIFLVTYPRSGTTRLQEIIFLIMSDLDYDTARHTIMDDRFPYLDSLYPGIKAIDAKPSPRLLKTHYPYQLLPNEVYDKNPKIIYSARNPKDVIVSRYHVALAQRTYLKESTIEDAFDSFMRNTGNFTPWWRHVLGFWERRDEKNILFITYEEMSQNTTECIHKVAKFLGKTLTDSEVETIVEHCRIENMRQNPSTNFTWIGRKNFILRLAVKPEDPGWIRKGTIGDWKSHLTPEMSDAVDRMVQEKFQGTGLEFFYGNGERRDDSQDHKTKVNTK